MLKNSLCFASLTPVRHSSNAERITEKNKNSQRIVVKLFLTKTYKHVFTKLTNMIFYKKSSKLI